jgi:type IV secretory pathway VirB9-like protein
MLKKPAALFFCFALAACASPEPKVVQIAPDAQVVNLTPGTATQIEMPDGERVQSVVTGKPSLVIADKADNVVNLVPGDGTGETNLIVRVKDSDNRSKVSQYRIIVQ